MITSARPHPALREDILRYAGAALDGRSATRMREPAFGGVAVVLALDGGWRLDVGGALQAERSFVGGLIDGPVIVEHIGPVLTLQFDCTPLGARRLLGVPGAELAGRCVDSDAVLGRDGPRLIEHLRALEDWPARFAALDAFLLHRRAAAVPVAPEAVFVWRRLVDTGGQASIAGLVEATGRSARHVTSVFRREVGMTPKAYARVVRFGGALAGVRAGRPLADVALDCGYYDQAHLNRDFRALAGLAPTALLAEDRAVTFVQDTPARAI